MVLLLSTFTPRCSSSLSPAALSVLEEIAPSLYHVTDHVIGSLVGSGNSIHSALILSEWLGFLCDFMEATPLSSLSQSGLFSIMYAAEKSILVTSYNMLRYLSPSYKRITTDKSKATKELATLVVDDIIKKGSLAAEIEDKEELCSKFIEILSSLLILIDHISSSDVTNSMRSMSGGVLIGIHNRNANDKLIGIDCLICRSVIMLSSQILTVDIINSDRQIQDKYLCIINLILRSHAQVFCQEWLNIGAVDVESKLSIIKNLLSQILCSVDSSDSSVGRLALLALKSFGVYHNKVSSMTFGDVNTSMFNTRLINEAVVLFLRLSLSYLLGMMMPVSNGSVTKGL